MSLQGTVKFFSSKGYGFIVQDSDQSELFVHTKEINGFPLVTNDRVTYDLGVDESTNKPVAVKVQGGTGDPNKEGKGLRKGKSKGKGKGKGFDKGKGCNKSFDKGFGRKGFGFDKGFDKGKGFDIGFDDGRDMVSGKGLDKGGFNKGFDKGGYNGYF